MYIVAPPAPGKIEDLRRRFFATPLQAVMSLISLAIMAFIVWKLLTWAVFSGSLPTGLSLNVNTGLISGTPSVAATYYFEIQVTDGLANTAKMNYQVVIA